jgi:hypothetical protein
LVTHAAPNAVAFIRLSASGPPTVHDVCWHAPIVGSGICAALPTGASGWCTVTEQAGASAGGAALFTTTNRGLTWSIPTPTWPSVTQMLLTSPTTAYVFAVEPVPNRLPLLETVDGGHSLVTVNLPLPSLVGGEAFPSLTFLGTWRQTVTALAYVLQIDNQFGGRVPRARRRMVARTDAISPAFSAPDVGRSRDASRRRCRPRPGSQCWLPMGILHIAGADRRICPLPHWRPGLVGLQRSPGDLVSFDALDGA